MASDHRHEIICQNVAGLLRLEREKQNLSMNEIAQRAGLSQQMVSYVERGMRNPTLETMLRMSAALGIDLGNLIKKASRK